jgi:hypothetical protein
MSEQNPYPWHNERFHRDACVDMKYIIMHYVENIQILGGEERNSLHPYVNTDNGIP